VATGALGAAAIAVFVFAAPQQSPRWTSGILFDDSVRDAVRVRSPTARDRLRLFSDVTGVSSLVWVVGVDSLLVPLWRGSAPVALQLLLLDAEAFALNGVLTSSMFYLSGRARPSYADCQRDYRFDPLCNPRDTASFWSGHTALAFTAAGLSCAHHAYIKLYGGGAPDTLACAGAIGLSATTGTLRLLGDRHYATDIATGALVGFGIGYAVPTLLHYAQGAGAKRRVGIAFGPVERGALVSAAGRF
jgi:membrane-associated phospholipid phosphatase